MGRAVQGLNCIRGYQMREAIGNFVADIGEVLLKFALVTGLLALAISGVVLLRPNQPQVSVGERDLKLPSDTVRGRLRAEGFLADIQSNRVDDTYRAYTAVFNRSLTKEVFKDFLSKQPKVTALVSPLICENSEAAPRDSLTFSCRAKSEDSESIIIQVDLQRANETFEIKSFSIAKVAEP
jgi:hypothetical protein